MWTIGYADQPDGPLPEPYLVVSNDIYNETGLGVIGVQVLPDTFSGTLYEPVPGVGTAQLDMIAWFPPGWLVEHIGDLVPARHPEVARLVRNLIGND